MKDNEFNRDLKAEQTAETPSMVNHPPHYTQGEIECIDAIRAVTSHLNGFEAYLTGTMLKYNWRWAFKNGVEDIEKMKWYADRLIEELKSKDRPFE